VNRRFRLATVERLRTARLEAGGRELVAAHAALQAGRDRRDLAAARLSGCATPTRVTADDLIALAARRDRLRQELADAEAELQAVIAAANRARAGWLQARAELRAVEALHQRHRDAVRADQLRAEQAEADDGAAASLSAGARVAAQRSGGEP
jgi:flagellar biosynthesis chaperone FliJ